MGAGWIPARGKGPAPWDSKGPRLVPIGGIGINKVETSYLIMTLARVEIVVYNYQRALMTQANFAGVVQW